MPLYRYGIKMFLHGEDAPIRVKGGSVFVEHTKFDWELDEDEDEREYHAKGKQNGWKVDIWKDEADMESGTTPVTFLGRRVIVHVDDGSGGPTDYRVKFRSNGSAPRRRPGQEAHARSEAAAEHHRKPSHHPSGGEDEGLTRPGPRVPRRRKGFIKLWPQP